MAPGQERSELVVHALRDAGLDALVCSLPANVLMLSGYWPVVGTALALVTAEGQAIVLAPEDEYDLAMGGWAARVVKYQPGSISRLTTPAEAVRQPLDALLREVSLERGRIGYEEGSSFEPATYAAMHIFGSELAEALRAAVSHATLVPARMLLARLRARLMPDEVAQVRRACEIAQAAFSEGAKMLHPGLREAEAAAGFADKLSELGARDPGSLRAGGFVYCMSGENAARAGAAYARTGERELEAGDLVLVHCNSYLNGYWTDITRTYCLGEPDERQATMYEAVFAARAAALAAIRPEARAAEVDAAARAVMTDHGFGANFTHGTGHNVGFSAISTEFAPRLHPASDDRLESGMTFNIEPAIYIEGYGGIRHCDVVTLGDQGPEVLTPFQDEPTALVITRAGKARGKRG